MMDEDPDLPNPIGVFRAVPATAFDEAINAQVTAAREKKGPGTLEQLIYSGETWTVE
jgi:2-oxoglutarate ferredoxin oxidoreductase subunit beta